MNVVVTTTFNGRLYKQGGETFYKARFVGLFRIFYQQPMLQFWQWMGIEKCFVFRRVCWVSGPFIGSLAQLGYVHRFPLNICIKINFKNICVISLFRHQNNFGNFSPLNVSILVEIVERKSSKNYKPNSLHPQGLCAWWFRCGANFSCWLCAVPTFRRHHYSLPHHRCGANSFGWRWSSHFIRRHPYILPYRKW